ncbi:tRNA (guanine-N(7)-)-methyltransferase non-catalytic subunit wdr4 [Paramormyrops kingsleyae]|uniref:tRNA (guanine-N(7)-)-methyltransferase non-catalytic subunit wdr4 n=1 Tax=Paramormyrops kingsleyae TaxID=1676925 RepID=UPI003B97B495
MAALAACEDWVVVTSGKSLIAVSIKSEREPFLYDCSKAEQKPKDSNNKSEEGGSEESSTDKILAFAISSCGKFCALTDDRKRLVLFRTEPSWHCVSIRWVVRRCTSLVFTEAEDEILVADKSGDVYSFSVLEPEKEGQLKLGHLSMLLAVAVSNDDKYVITADRDEKIRVSVLKSPHNIQSFCLGHREFVSALCTSALHPDWLMSGSGDGTVKLWEYETGLQLQSLDLKELAGMSPSNTKRFAISRVVGSPDGNVAVLCESVPAVHLFRAEVETEQKLIPSETLMLPHCAWDLTFDPRGHLWVLLESQDQPILLYTHTQDGWECERQNPELKMVMEALQSHWDMFLDSLHMESPFKHLYKVNFDNMASYLQKKQERIQQQEQKGGKKRVGQLRQSNGAKKKAKLDTATAVSHDSG